MKTDKKDKQGFTIIEVVLVLAIAGLIFLIVFLAVPALQRSQRDTQRRSDMGRMLSQLTQYQSNNQGAVPTSQGQLDGFISTYMNVNNEEFTDPSQGAYDPVFRNGPSGGGSDLPVVDYHLRARCNGDTPVSAGSRDIAVSLQLEGGGRFCQDNS